MNSFLHFIFITHTHVGRGHAKFSLDLFGLLKSHETFSISVQIRSHHSFE